MTGKRIKHPCQCVTAHVLIAGKRFRLYLEPSAGLLTAFRAAIVSPQVLVPPLVGMMVSESLLFLHTCIVFQPLLPQILNYQYRLSCNTTNIYWKKIALQLVVTVVKFATGMHGTGLSLELFLTIANSAG